MAARADPSENWLGARCKGILYGVDVSSSARRHGIADADIIHAWEQAIYLADQEYDGEERIFAIGPDRQGRLLELVAVPDDAPTRIIHADRLRSRFYDKLR